MPWAFFCLAGPLDQAPPWIVLANDRQTPTADLAEITQFSILGTITNGAYFAANGMPSSRAKRGDPVRSAGFTRSRDRPRRWIAASPAAPRDDSRE